MKIKQSNPAAKKIISTLALGFISILASHEAFGKTCDYIIGSDDQMRYVNPQSPQEVIKKIEIDAKCSEVKLTLKHIGKLPKTAMGHNWILTNTTWQEMMPLALKVGINGDYVPKDDKRVVAATKLVGGGESTTTSFSTKKLTPGKEYDFFCGFPAHAAAGMNGKFVIKSEKDKASAH